MADFNYVAFYADDHHRVRVIRANLEHGEIGGEVDRHLARFCKFLDGKFPGSTVTYFPQSDSGPTASYLVDLDTNEYLLWAAEAEEDICVVPA